MKKKMFASMMVLGMLVPGVVAPLTTAHAADVPQLKIKKVLNLPAEGVKTPAESFTFTFTPHSKNNNTDLVNDVPKIKDVVISYTEEDKKDHDAATDGKQVIKTSTDALTGVEWKESGQYTYTVTETKPAAATDGMTYSQASYTVSVFTKKDANGTIIVDTIQIKQDKKDNGEAVEKPTKTEYNPGSTDEDVKGNNFSFSNDYDKKGGNKTPDGNNPTPDVIPDADMSGFALMKTVVGTGGKINDSESFKFSLKAVKPVGSHSTDETFTYKIVSGTTVGEEKTAKYNEAFDIELKHHDRVVFGDILLGSTVSATETFDAGYTKTVGANSLFNGNAVTTLDDLTNGKVIGNEGKNGVYFVNTQQTPTGIFMDNLPYIVLVAVAGLGLIFFVKRRRDTEEA